MISEKMYKFLSNVCKIESPELFDFSFGKMKKYANGDFDFEIIKETPWSFDLLDYFVAHWPLTKYNISFAYNFMVSNSDIIDLLKGMYEKRYFKEPEASFEIQDNVILFESEKDVDKIIKIVSDFESLLTQINYPRMRVLHSEIENVEINFDQDPESSNLREFEENSGDLQRFLDVNETIDDDFEPNFDLEKEREELALKASTDYLNASKYMEKRLEGLDQSRRYVELNIEDLTNENMNVMIEAEISAIETREVKNARIKYTFCLTDHTDSIFATVIDNDKTLPKEQLDQYAQGQTVRLTGYTFRDRFTNNNIVIKITSMILVSGRKLRDDNAPEKRVELHLHTKMSNMDAVSTIDEYAKLAKHMGHKAIAITDHGVVQAFPDAQKAAKSNGIKMLYGAELYVVDDFFTGSYNPTDAPLNDLTYVVFDLESTGLSTRYSKIIEFGAVKIKNGIILDRLDILINPGMPLPKKIVEITKITDNELRGKPTIDKVIDEIMEFIGDATLVSHNLEFDFGLLNTALQETRGLKLINSGIDTLALSRYLNPEVGKHNLGALCRRNEVFYDEDAAHRADYDAEVLSKCWISLLATLNNRGLKTLDSIHQLEKDTEHIKHSFEKHTTVLAKNRKGLKALYKLISLSHIKYLGRYPCVPKNKLAELREDLLIGSSCFNGEVFDAALRLTEDLLEKTISFYDYIELQPIGNYSLFLEFGTNGLDSKEILDRAIADIIKTSQKLGKLICATGDVHYLNPEDHKYRDVYIYSAGVGKTSHPLYNLGSRKSKDNREKREEKGIYYDNPKQHFRTTEEMLEEFKIYGEENAYEWVIKNTNLIADMCEEIVPIPPDTLFTPKIENSEKLLREICYKNAHKLYGDTLPELIEKRLEKELSGIIDNGFSVIYYIAHLIIKKTHEDGYIVGSRGSVGSSFVATMANITEVNPLPPHYRCPKCRHFEVSEDPKYRSGYDLPVKKCPVCGETMIGDGQNIPFETFLGFNADKVPDIDLNFPPDYQAKAHNYTKILLGEKNCYRAGTIGTVAEKTAFGYCRKFFEKKYRLDPNYVPKARIAALAAGCKDVKRTTGQHPGGIVVIPNEFDVYDFTPIQYPADDMDATWMTTHLDFHAIHDTVLKLDLLGHVDPQALKFMCDHEGLNYLQIPLDDKKVFSIFSTPRELGLKHNYLKLTTGALAIPEFGTDFVRGMLESTKPSTFGDLVIISGLSHGTNVWRNNAESIIQSGITDLRGVIGCRDDIMTYLISMGVEPLSAFKYMELIRKGKRLSPQQEEDLIIHKVPEYYIESCRKIKYLFPKAHATAYVTMAIRVAWFKVYKPLVFYAGFFSVRCDKYEWAPMYEGPEAILNRLKELEVLKREHPNDYSKKYEEIEKTLTVALEMYDRGYSFSKLDIYKSDSKNFIIDEETKTLIPPFKVVDGLGEAAAENIIKGREGGRFTSIKNFEKRTKLNQTLLETFRNLGCFDGMSEEDRVQLSLFDFN